MIRKSSFNSILTKNTRRRMLWCIGMNKVRLLCFTNSSLPDDFWRDTNCNRVYFGGLYSSVGPGPGRDDEVTAGGFLRDERKKDSREYSDSG